MLQTNPEKYSKFCTDRSSLNTASTILRSCFPIADTRCLYLYSWIIFATFILSNFALFHFHFRFAGKWCCWATKGTWSTWGKWSRMRASPLPASTKLHFQRSLFPFHFQKIAKVQIYKHSKMNKAFSEVKILFRFQKISKSKKLQKSLKMHIFASKDSRVTYHCQPRALLELESCSYFLLTNCALQERMKTLQRWNAKVGNSNKSVLNSLFRSLLLKAQII